jgi:hypothetical protein
MANLQLNFDSCGDDFALHILPEVLRESAKDPRGGRTDCSIGGLSDCGPKYIAAVVTYGAT